MLMAGPLLSPRAYVSLRSRIVFSWKDKSGLPNHRTNLDRFEQEVRIAREAGVEIFRAVMLGPLALRNVHHLGSISRIQTPLLAIVGFG